MDIDCERAERIKLAVDELATAIFIYWNSLCNVAEPELSMEWDEDDRRQLLKVCTKIVRLTELTIACYPLSESAVYLLDENGDPIP